MESQDSDSSLISPEEAEFLTSGISNVDQRGLPVSEQAVSARVIQLQLEGFGFGGNLLRPSVNHNILFRLSCGKLDQARHVGARGVCVPVNGGGVFQALSADYRDSVESIR